MAGGRSFRAMRFALLLIPVILSMPPVMARDRVRVLAVLSTQAAPYRQHLERFQDGLSVEVESVTLPPEPEKLSRRLEKEPPDLILALGSSAAGFVSGLNLSTPLVFSMVYDPLGDGLPAGPNQCGLALQIPPEARLKALQALRPGVNKIRVGVLHNPQSDSRELEALKQILKKHNYPLVVKEVAGPDQLHESLQAILPQIDVLWILFEPSLIPDEDVLRDYVLRPAVDAKVAVIGLSDPHVQKGALMAVSVDFAREGEHAARLAERVLTGESPQKIGVEPPEYIIWSLNLNVAREIGWEVPPLVRKRFERVYQ